MSDTKNKCYKKEGRMVLWVCGLLSLLYFAGLWIYLGAVYSFQWFWLALSVFFFVVGELLPRWGEFPRWFRWLWKVGAAAVLIVFAVLLALIFSGMVDEPSGEADYVIVLGAKVDGTTPSLSLRYRIEAARDYLADNPRTLVIASGGQGSNEGISEARAISNTLISMGVAQERILLEDRSTSTRENLAFSKECIHKRGGNPASARVVLVTSDFHVFRAKALARESGYEKVEGLSAKSVAGLQPHHIVRECLAILNDGLRGNLDF